MDRTEGEYFMNKTTLILMLSVSLIACLGVSQFLKDRVERAKDSITAIHIETRRLRGTRPLKEVLAIQEQTASLNSLPEKLGKASYQRAVLLQGAELKPRYLFLNPRTRNGQTFEAALENEETAMAFFEEMGKLQLEELARDGRALKGMLP
jgi:hypothetical protein